MQNHKIVMADTRTIATRSGMQTHRTLTAEELRFCYPPPLPDSRGEQPGWRIETDDRLTQ